MIQKIKFLIISILLILLSACATLKQPSAVIQSAIDSLFVDDFFKSSQAAISAYDLSENKPLYSINEKLLMHPASNLKILTTAAGYLFLGADYNFKTSIYYTGDIKDSICTGNFFIKGGFDPDFSLSDLDSLVLQIKKCGIKNIHGNLYADVSAMDSLFWGEGWMWDDDPSSFAAYLTPLCINKNRIKVISEPGEIGKPVNVELIPDTKFISIKNISATTDSAKKTFKVTRDWLNRNNTIIAMGNLSASSQPEVTLLNVFNPTFYFLNLMKENLTGHGITLEGKIDTLTLGAGSQNFFSLQRNIEPIIKNANKNSDNLSAEMLLRALASKKNSSHASAKDGIVFVDSLITLTGMNYKNYRIVDGSGASAYNLLSSELILEVLKYLYFQQPNLFEKIFDSFPIAGYDGTLSDRMKHPPLSGNVHAKTGSMRGVSALSGYLRNRRNHLIAFSILSQHFSGSAAQARAIQDKICKILYETN